MAFAPLLKKARAWLKEPDDAALLGLVEAGRGFSPLVPEARREDWEKLLASIDAAPTEEERPKNVARVEGIVRACKLFDRPPIGETSTVDLLPGIGPTARLALAEHGIRTVADLVWLPPSSWDDLRTPIPLAEAIARAKEAHEREENPARVVASAVVKSAGVIPLRGRRGVRVVLADPNDDKCTLSAFWFFLAHGVLQQAKVGAPMLFLGRIRIETGKPARTAHPELLADAPEIRNVRPRYPRLAAKATKRGPPEGSVRKAIAHALEEGVAPDPVPAPIAEREGFVPAKQVLAEVHAQGREVPPEPAKRAFVERLAWAEAFTRVWERIATDAATTRDPAPPLAKTPELVAKLETELGFAFTNDQRRAIAEIETELAKDEPMRRLLLGDVGTGKTAVALAAAAQCIASGKQVAILAPTSVLAEQYLDAVKPLERALETEVAYIAAGMPASARKRAERNLRIAEAKIAVGTHALLSEGVEIPELGLVVVDEQQRLGVAQRLSLVRKGARPHLLTLSATPIPRTLMLALRGELATSTLRERPAGRPPVATSLAGRSEIPSVVERVRETIARGERVFWVVPRIEEDEEGSDDEDPMASAVARARALGEALGADNVVLLHGGLRPSEKHDVMRRFRSGEVGVLVGTTVIEVGVDVPEATLMVVEDAERFGLSQLHQLRGRVGRGRIPGSCVLVHPEPLEGPARPRMKALVELSDGDAIAKADLELRGAGDLGGTRQHGAEEELVYLEAGATYRWLERVEADANAMLAKDPTLEGHPVLGSLVARMRRVIAVREEAG